MRLTLTTWALAAVATALSVAGLYELTTLQVRSGWSADPATFWRQAMFLVGLGLVVVAVAEADHVLNGRRGGRG